MGGARNLKLGEATGVLQSQDPRSHPFLPILNFGIGGVPIPGFWNYKNLLKIVLLSHVK